MDSSSSSALYFQAIYPFNGDAAAGQLSFAQGALLRVQSNHAAAATQGWTWGSLIDQENVFGWFPTGYAVLTSPPASTSRPTLPWIKQEPVQQRDDDQESVDFTESMLGGQSPALDYSSANTDLHGRHSKNPFEGHVLDKMHDNERITIVVNNDTNRKFGKRLQKSWQKAGAASTKLLSSRRRVVPQDPMVPSISVTPSTQQ